MVATFWSLVPALAAIVLALMTKKVYFSLILGILAGALFFTQFDLRAALEASIQVMADKTSGNLNIIIFLVLLGMLVALIQRSGAAAAYGRWASSKINNRRQAEALTGLLGVLIFVDDYFNCLTVGTVMNPVTDRFNISRAKLSYLIDATAAPVCIIAPISSWAAAVGSSLPENSDLDGFILFLQTIPMNYYALGTLAMVFGLIAFNISFGRMRTHELQLAQSGEHDALPSPAAANEVADSRATIIDLMAPVLFLIAACVFFMVMTGGIFEGESFVQAFANCNSSFSLVMGSMAAIVFTALLYLPRRVLNFTEFNDCLTDGFIAMVPAILILALAWTLSGISGEGYLECGAYVSQIIESNNLSLTLIPAVFFLVALGLAFATGTSWGTFGILVPIVVTLFASADYNLLVLSVAAVLAGAVNGDHISPISDTTILSSAGANVNHLTHVSTQIPYAMTVTVPAFLGYLVAGYFDVPVVGLIITLVGVALLLAIMKMRNRSEIVAA